jgi:hypothetical protein
MMHPPDLAKYQAQGGYTGKTMSEIKCFGNYDPSSRRLSAQKPMSPSRFDQNKVFRTPEDVARLAQRLAKLPEVVRFDQGGHKEG